MLTCN